MNERKLIYANDLKKELLERDFFPTIVKSALERLPAVDAVEVVRCKDCMYREEATVNTKGFLICPAIGMVITENDFCSYGERKEQ